MMAGSNAGIYVLFSVLFFAGTCYSAEVCHHKSDVVVVFELPKTGDVEALEQIKQTIGALNVEYQNGDCIQLAFDIVSTTIDKVQYLGCHGLCRKAYTAMKIDDILSKLRRTTDIDRSLYKENVVKAANSLHSHVFIKKEGVRKDSRKVAVFVLTSGPSDTVSIVDNVKFLHDIGYTIIVVGVGDGREEDLIRISLASNRIITATNMSQLTGGGIKYQQLTEIVKNPESVNIPSTISYSVPVGVNEFDFVTHDSEEKCKYAADIGFLVDSSGSLKLDYDLELQFVQRIAASFQITETESHAGVITFSDHTKYTKLQIPLNKYYTTREFVNAVGELEYFGYRTRIDLAFDIAQNELFTLKNGARPSFKRIIFLITDGNQFPAIDEYGNKLDPVASSQQLYDDGVQIFVVGIGTALNKEELKKIARDPSRVYSASNFNDLLSEEFVKNVSKKLCQGGQLGESTTASPVTSTQSTSTEKAMTSSTTNVKTLISTSLKPSTSKSATSKTTAKPVSTPKPTAPSPTTTCEPTPTCKGVRYCKECCSGKEIYINIFQPGSSPQYLMQGLKISQSGNSGALSAINIQPSPQPRIDISTKGRALNEEEIVDLIKTKLPNEPDVLKQLQSILGNRRHKRSLNQADLNGFETLFNIGKAAGCKKFLQDLSSRLNVLKRLKNGMVVFCPNDAAYTQYIQKENVKYFSENTLMFHTALAFDKERLMYRPIIGTGDVHITLDSQHNTTWLANDAKIEYYIRDKKIILIVIDKVLTPPKLSLMDILKEDRNLSIMYRLWKKSDIGSILKRDKVTKICFTEEVCVHLQTSARQHISNLIKSKKFTFQLPTNDVFSRMNPKKFQKLISNGKSRTAFLSKHVFLGFLNYRVLSGNTKLLGVSLLDKEPVSEVLLHRKKPVMSRSNGDLYQIDRSITVKEGLVQIVS